MGLTLSQMLKNLLGQDDIRIVMVGLDNAGKTTLLCKMKLGEVVNSLPTTGFNVEVVKYKKLRFTVWDIGGHTRIRDLWFHYFVNTMAVIFVVDSTDIKRLSEAADELHLMVQRPELENAVLLVMANKQDLPKAASAAEITKQMRLNDLTHDWHLQETSAATGAGILNGFEYLQTKIKRRNDLKP